MRNVWMGAALLVWSGAASAMTMTFDSKAAFDAAAPGAESVTGTLDNLGNVGTSETIGDVTLTADNTIFVEGPDIWSTKIPGNDIAISGPENLRIAVNINPADAFGFFFHEPASSTERLDGCNATCVDSTFSIEFFDGMTSIDTLIFEPLNDKLVFFGWTSDTAFNRIVFKETTGGIDNEFFGEMYAQIVPLPAAVWLFGSALIGLALLGRRRR